MTRRSKQLHTIPGDSLPRYLEPILNTSCAAHNHLAVAVSGGADSMALALLLKHWCAAHQVRLSALTVDHGLRAASAGEARQVAAWMQQHGIAHTILKPAMRQIKNLQARARDMRYRALTEWCQQQHAALLVAHHADDQAETVALQKHRGESPPSRAGMALVARRGGVMLIRPLLGVRKTALIAFLESLPQAWIDDPTNAQDRYARNRLRRTLGDADIHALWHEAQRYGEQRHADDVARNAWLAAHARGTNSTLSLDAVAWQALPDTMRSDLLSQAIRVVGGKPFRPRRHETARLAGACLQQATGKATLGHCVIAWDADTLRITPEPLDSRANAPHISGLNSLKQLASEPFWWFNHALFS